LGNTARDGPHAHPLARVQDAKNAKKWKILADLRLFPCASLRLCVFA
jgi:hypothetical protein